MSAQASEVADAPATATAKETLLHRAIARVSQEFLGTAEGQPPYEIITFAIPGFSESELLEEDRESFERISAEVGGELASILDRQLAERELIATVTEATEAFRVKVFREEPDSAKVYAALADTVDATVYYNR